MELLRYEIKAGFLRGFCSVSDIIPLKIKKYTKKTLLFTLEYFN